MNSAIYPFGGHDFGRGSSCDSGYMNNLSESYNFWQQIQWLIKANVGFMCQAFVKPSSGLTVTAGSPKSCH